MKLIAFLSIVLMTSFASAQSLVQRAANKAGANVAYTYEFVGNTPDASVYSDDEVTPPANATIQNFKTRFEEIEGVSEVLYDLATNLFSITATLDAVLPEQMNTIK